MEAGTPPDDSAAGRAAGQFRSERAAVTPWVLRLIIANIVAYFLQQTMPGLMNQLVLYPPWLLTHPWTVVTYMFLHGGLGHIFFNMLSLFIFGPRVEVQLGSRRFLTLYLISGLTGALLSVIFSPAAGVIGASGATFGVTLAFARFWPREQIYIWGVLPVEARWLVIIMAGMTLMAARGGGGGIAHFAHLGGFAGAFLYLRWLENFRGAKAYKRKAAPKVADNSLSGWKNVDPTRVHEVNRDELNRVLDKVGASGLASLTPDERRFLASFVPPDDRISPPT